MGWVKGWGRALVAVAQIDHIVQVDAGQNGEDEGLQEGHEELQRGQADGHAQRQQRRPECRGQADGAA